MAQPDGPDGAHAAHLATLPRALALSEAQVIGTFGSFGDRRALLRHASGKTQMIANGDGVLGGRVVKVDEGGVDILRDGRIDRFALPDTDAMAVSLRPRPNPAFEDPDANDPRRGHGA
ncbi:MAG: hypothetical protein AAFU80_00900 [Pseudomonadota bacterium]